MPTFSAIKTYVSRRLLDTNNVAVSVDDVGTAINDAISYWKFRRFWFNETSGPLVMTPYNGIIPLIGNFLVPVTEDDGFYISYGNVRYPLRKISKQQYDGVYLDNGYGLPNVYVGGSYQAYPLPDQAYPIYGNFLEDYEPLVNDTDTNDLTENAARLIQLWALANLSAELRQDDKMETYYRGAAQDEYRNLRVMSGKTNGTGKLTLYSALI